MTAPPTLLPDPSGGFLGTRRKPAVQATALPPSRPAAAPAPPCPGKAPSGRPAAPPRATPAPAPSRPRKAPSRPAAGQAPARPPAPVPVGVGTPDALLRRYGDALGYPPPVAHALTALLHGLLTEHAEVIAQHLEHAADANAAEPLHADAAPHLRHAAEVVRAGFGVRPMR